MADDGSTGSTPVAKQALGDRAAFRLAVFAAVLILAVSAGFGAGRLTGRAHPDRTAAAQPMTEEHAHDPAHDPAPAESDEVAPHAHGTDGDATVAAGTQAAAVTAPVVEAGGLAVSSAGLTLVPQATTFRVGRAQPLRFHIAAAGTPVTTFAVVHGKALHLVVVRRDLSGYRHLHPVMAADGTWSIDLTLGAPGSWRAYADFTAIVDGKQTPVTLGVDLTVPGDYAPVTLPAAARQATAHGFTVAYQGTPSVGVTQPLLVTVAGAAGPATLQPYLGAYGHLVVLREGDLGYVHVHPEPHLIDGAVKFWLAAPGPGRYRMFFDFQVDGTVHTGAFTTTVM